MLASRSGTRPRIVIHGGMHKTGTTSAQQWLFQNRHVLVKYGIAYPGDIEQHSSILNAKQPLWNSQYILELLRDAEMEGAESVIFSGEVVSTFSVEQFRKITDCLGDYVVTYIFCFRHWREYLPSRWAQYCKRRDSHSFQKYLQRVINSEHIDYRFDLILARAAMSGADRVLAISYDNAVRKEGSIIREILRAAGCSEQLIRFVPADIAWSNKRADGGKIELVRLFNGVIADRLGLPPDELFESVQKHQICKHVFDLFSSIDMLDDNEMGEIHQAIRDRAASHTFAEGWHPPCMQLLSDCYGSLFTNKIEQRIFPVDIEKVVPFSALDCRDLSRGAKELILKTIDGWKLPGMHL